jgi:hypothetical protein
MSTESNPLLRSFADPKFPDLLAQLEKMAANSNAVPNDEEKQRWIAAIRRLPQASPSAPPLTRRGL